MWDFDFKIDKCILLNDYIQQFDIIFNFITFNIIETLNETFNNPNIQYIYADKNIGYGIHLYFPNIIVNKNVHSYLFNTIKNKIIKNNSYPIEIINHIFDPCVSKANGLRMFYYNYNNNFYKPNKNLSTFVFEDEPELHFKYSIINTDNKELVPKLKINLEDIENNIFNINNKIKKQDVVNNIIKDDIEYINDFTYLQLGDKKQMFIDLANSLNLYRIDEYNNWIKLLYLFKTYGLYDEIITLSKKSSKYNNDSLKYINNIWNKKRVPINCLTIGSLIKWARDDNFNNTVQILEKYNINLKLKINNIDEILLLHSSNKINYIEESMYISNNIIKQIIIDIDSNKINVVLLQSPTGSGKTTQIKQILLSLKKYNYSILSIVTRRSMCSTHINAFNFTKNDKGDLVKDNSFNFSSYLDKTIYNDDEFISSLEHLFVFKQFYDVIILDELFSLCSYLYSDTLIGRRKECITHLKNLISNAKLIIGADAQIADICFQLFNDKNIYFYKNTFKNKINIPFNIHISSHSVDNSNLTKISHIIGYKYCKNNKSVLIFSDRKNTTVKLFELLKIYNNNNDYFRVFNADCGELEDINNIDTISKNRCLISSPRIIYGIDITTKYDEIFCIYSKTHGTNSMSSFEWYQQLSRARFCNKVNIYILDSSVTKFYNSYISFDKNKSEETKHIDNYIYYTKKLYEKYNVVNEITSIDNNYFKNIHFYKSWYDCIFSNNKLEILKLLAIQFGYNVSEISFDSFKIKSDLDNKVKLNYQLIKDISLKIINNEPIHDLYKYFVPNITEQINNRKKYINKNDNDYMNILSDENKFNSYLKKKMLDLSKEDFDKKIIKINNQDINEIIKDNLIFNQINSIFWLETQLDIVRYDVNSININISIESIKNILNNNIDKLFYIFNDGRSKKYILNRINNIINKINSYNKLQKFYVDIINGISDDIFTISLKKYYNGNLIIYTFIKK